MPAKAGSMRSAPMLVLLSITAAMMPMTAWARHPQMRQLRAYKMRITPASPMRCQGSPSTSASKWDRVNARVPPS